jgi:hypothetical protein
MVDAAWHYMTYQASFFFILGVRLAWETHIVTVMYGLAGAGYCLWIFIISATSFTISHKVITVLTLLCQLPTNLGQELYLSIN